MKGFQLVRVLHPEQKNFTQIDEKRIVGRKHRPISHDVGDIWYETTVEVIVLDDGTEVILEDEFKKKCI